MSVASIAAASGEEAVSFDISRSHQPVFHALIDARSRYGGERAAIVDGDERVLTYEEIIRAALALGHALKRGTRAGESVGILLPTGAGAVIAFFAVSAYGRVPAMLNFTSPAGINSMDLIRGATGNGTAPGMQIVTHAWAASMPVSGSPSCNMN